MKSVNIRMMSALAAFMLAVTPMSVSAAEGDVIVTLGEDLSEQQRNSLLEEMQVDDSAEIITVSNEEEYEYLGEYLGDEIGSNALSSSKITIAPEGEGISVDTNNITKVSEGMYANALVTAGVEDAEVYVTAPTAVSGTAGLTGLIKAYETQTGTNISEEQKQVANEEMVKTSELGESIGTEEATELITRIKEEISNQNIETEEDLRNLIEQVANDLGVSLTEEEMNGLVSLFERMQNLNIDWDQVQSQISDIRNNLDEFLNREDTQSFISSFLDFINQLIDSLSGWFGGNEENAS
ncbi:DUF1002 domain-containing protein [Salibacterium qingdaonense]|uniref:Uncharacterized protein YpuA, DUF1002 family n=1 Tax=Salibacterium qingdaonense TaxID=266892 RepID=A0A1I4JKJ4_9BACI|nr:DUF1002 domain-containing protein [Salibacterium qingdaonense]SFL67082.1 Uncharacterized protein YpuA, DUF1002 family [Salibacterium qingdaonense]